MKEYSFLTENARTDFLLKHRSARKVYGLARDFLNSKTAFPVTALTYGVTTLPFPSGSVYAIGLSLLPQGIRKPVIKKLLHAKSKKDLTEIMDVLKEYAKTKKSSLEERLMELVGKKDLVPNLMKGFKTPEVLSTELEQGIADKVADASGKVLNRNPALALAS